MRESTVPLFNNPDVEMKESTVNPHFDSVDDYLEVLQEYLVLTDDVEMDNRASHADADISPVPLLPFHHSNSNNPPFNPHMEICPLPWHASDMQDPRNNDNDSTPRLESILSPTHPNTPASAGTAVRFLPNSDSPLFKVGNKRHKEGHEEYQKQNEKRVHVRAIQLCDEFVC
jgi:hypothetical protein